MNTTSSTPDLRLDTRLCAGVFAIAFATLVFEVSLIRLFSFTIWHHFAYLVISVALLGTGAAGSYLTRYPSLARNDIRTRLSWLALAASVSATAFVVLAAVIPFDPLRAADPSQWMWLTLYYVLAFVPFFLAGLCLALVFSAAPLHMGRLYFWDLLGAGIGSLVPLSLISILGVPGLLSLGAIGFAVAAVLLDGDRRALTSPVRMAIAAAVLLAVVAPASFPPVPSPAKALHFYQKSPDAKVLSSQWHPIARVDAVEYPLASELRANPDSQTTWWYGKELPADRRIVYDGDASPSIIRFDGNIDSLSPIDKLVQQTPYTIAKPNPSVLIIGLGGGFDALVAIRNRARRIVGVDIHPLAIELVRDDFADYAGRIYQRPEVEVHAAEGRAFVSRTRETFDLLQMTSVDSLTARQLGAYLLAENYLFTVEAIHDFLDAVGEDGIFSIIDNSGADAIREAGLIVTALAERGIDDPENHMIVTSRGHRQLGLVNTLVRMKPFTDEEVAKVQAFASGVGNPVLQVPGPGIPDEPISQFVRFSPEERRDFWENHPLSLFPTRDDSPFFHNFHRWRAVLKGPGGHLMQRESRYGQFVLLAILVQTIVFSAVFILAPLRRLREPSSTMRARLSTLLYFTGLGAGFMMLEISFVQRSVLFLGSPAYAISTVLAGLLVSAGVGSYTIERSNSDDVALLRQSTIVLVLLVVLYSFGLPSVFRTFLYAPTPARFAIGLLLTAPIGLVLGRFLPIGIRILGRKAPELVPWAWGINASASVVTTILAVIVAMRFGFLVVGLVSLVFYVCGAIALGTFARRAPDVVRA